MDASGVVGIRLKEATNINLSLSVCNIRTHAHICCGAYVEDRSRSTGWVGSVSTETCTGGERAQVRESRGLCDMSACCV